MHQRIFFVLYSLPRGGKERRFLELLGHLNRMKITRYHILILTTKVEYEQVREYDNLEILNVHGRFKQIKRFLYYYNCVRKYKPTVIHSWGKTPAIFSCFVKRTLSIPTISSFINDVPPNGLSLYWKLLTQFIIWNTDKVLSNTKSGLNVFQIPDKKGVCIYNGFSMSRVKLHSKKSEDLIFRYKIDHKYVIGMVGALDIRKDFITFIQVANELCLTRKDVLFFVIGDGKMKEQVMQTVDLTVADRIIFTGMISNVEEYISIMDIGVLLSNLKVHGEGISNTILEYMASSKPVIASLGGGNHEIIEEGENGFLIKSNEIELILEKINFLIDNPELASNMGARGRLMVEKKFSIDRMGNEFLELYNRVHK